MLYICKYTRAWNSLASAPLLEGELYEKAPNPNSMTRWDKHIRLSGPSPGQISKFRRWQRCKWAQIYRKN